MWLERFSGQPAPSPAPRRPYSPASVPRRSSHLAPDPLPQRPGLRARDTSLSILTNGSTTELPLAAKLPNGSSLRNQLSSSPANDAPDPLDILEEILSPVRATGTEMDAPPPVSNDTGSIQDIDFGGLSLQAFAETVQSAQPRASPSPVFEDSDQTTARFDDLHKSIAACDQVLKSVESYLTSFQADLAAVSAEIETLQNRSAALNNRLETRKQVEKLLGPEVDALSLAPAVVRKLTEGAFDDSWIKALQDFDKRAKAIDARTKSAKGVKAIEDLQPLIKDLRDRTVERIRDYVVAQIKALRSPGINAQVQQQNAFLRYKDVFAFLAGQQPQLGDEISQAYINTMRWYYSSSFTRYKTVMEKLHVHVIDLTDVLANEVKRPTVLAGSKYSVAPHDAFVLGRRMDVLNSASSFAMPSYVAEENKSTHYLEVPFRAFNLALVDNASAEYSFLTDFFSKQAFHAVNRKFNEIFEPSFALGQALTKQLVDQTVDALGILMCVRLNQHSAFELQRRKVPSMEGYINRTSMLLWPRFQMVMDMHCESLRKATASLPGRPAGSALSLTSSASSSQSVAPHPITQRFAHFMQGILALSSEAGDDEPVQRSLGRLRVEFEAFLTKLSKSIAELKKRERLLFNNYSLVGTIISETEGKMAVELKTHFAELRHDLAQRQ